MYICTFVQHNIAYQLLLINEHFLEYKRKHQLKTLQLKDQY